MLHSLLQLTPEEMKLTEDRRHELISDYVDRIIENMSTKDLCRIVGDQLEENLESYTMSELLTEVAENYPEILEDNEASIYAPEEYQQRVENS
jgi:hypothetical protein